MSPTLTCLALALVGVELGYQPASNGGEEFIVQISPATLQAISEPEVASTLTCRARGPGHAAEPCQRNAGQ